MEFDVYPKENVTAVGIFPSIREFYSPFQGEGGEILFHTSF